MEIRSISATPWSPNHVSVLSSPTALTAIPWTCVLQSWEVWWRTNWTNFPRLRWVLSCGKCFVCIYPDESSATRFQLPYDFCLMLPGCCRVGRALVKSGESGAWRPHKDHGAQAKVLVDLLCHRHQFVGRPTQFELVALAGPSCRLSVGLGSYELFPCKLLIVATCLNWLSAWLEPGRFWWPFKTI